jgi:hypothetical protein
MQFKRNRNDRSWKHRSSRGWHFAHGLKEGHGSECAARTPCTEVDPGRIGRSRRSERSVSRIYRTSLSFSKCYSAGTARPGISDRSVRANTRPTAPVDLIFSKPHRFCLPLGLLEARMARIRPGLLLTSPSPKRVLSSRDRATCNYSLAPGVTEVTADRYEITDLGAEAQRRYGMSRRHDCSPPLPAALVDRGTSGVLYREGRQRPAAHVVTSAAMAASALAIASTAPALAAPRPWRCAQRKIVENVGSRLKTNVKRHTAPADFLARGTFLPLEGLSRVPSKFIELDMSQNVGGH